MLRLSFTTNMAEAKLNKKTQKKIATRTAFINVVKNTVEDLKIIYSDYEHERHYEELLSCQELIIAQVRKFNIIQEEIIDLVNEDVVEYEIREGFNFEQFINKEIIILNRFLKKHSSNEAATTVSSSSAYLSMKLPKLEIKKFKGDPTMWQSFHDSFDCAVHQNESLSNIQKMNYLINFVEGQAAETIKGLSLKNDNYLIALDLLKERFGDDQAIISAHMSKLLSVERVKNISDTKGLRKLTDVVKSQIRGLNSVGIEAKNFGPLLIPVVFSKIPDEIKLTSVYNISDYFYWTDSSIAFAWINNNNKEYKTFVQNRVIEIKNLSKFGVWKLITSKENPADISSRGVTPTDLCFSELWSHGPKFLTLPETRWPQLKPGHTFNDEIEKEQKRNNTRIKSIVPECDISCDSSCLLRAVRVNNINLKVDDSCLSEVINIRNYNSLNKLLRVTAWVMRFISNLKKKTEERRQEQLNNIRVLAEELLWLSADEMYQAKLVWIKDAQKTAMNHKNFKDWKVSLNLFTDEKNLLRCRGRLEHAPIPYEAKYPLLLTTDAYLTTLVVLDSHNMVAHNRTRQTLNHIRQTF